MHGRQDGSSERATEVGRLLEALARGERAAFDALLPLVYEELHGLAQSAMRRMPPGHSLQPTALLHEAITRLVAGDGASFASRDHLMAVSAKAMRSVLVDHARRRNSNRRVSPSARVELTDSVAGYEERGLNLLAVEEALERLARFDPQLEQVVELLFFAGLTAAEAGRVLECSSRSVERHWRAAKAFLRASLEDGEGPL